ncbi:MAG TPA: C4-dicarboxylate TRAP transporter substrate-binding protein [Burkholderiales bacterium]|nr:C4-dicarboxylate TRAP transporter substrate-binding protein [Burkholderiales bacterium]
MTIRKLLAGPLGAGVLAAYAGLAVPALAQQTINLTAIDGYPPRALWVKEFINFYIPEVDKRLAKSGQYKIRWNQAWGGQIVKPRGVLEGIQKGLGDIGVVTTAIYGDKMKIMSVAYMTPFTTIDPALVAETIDELADKFPGIKKTFDSYNQVYLTNSVVFDSYQMFSKNEARSLKDYEGVKIASAGPNLRYLPPTGAVGVAGSLNTYYNLIQTGVVDGCMLWPEAAATFKLAEVAPYMMKADIGTANSKVVSVNKDTWNKLPDEVRTVLQEVAIAYRDHLAKLAASLGDQSLARYKKAGGKVYTLPQADRSKWAKSIPNIAKEWAQDLDKEGLQGSAMLTYYMDRMRAAKQPIERQWDKE